MTDVPPEATEWLDAARAAYQAHGDRLRGVVATGQSREATRLALAEAELEAATAWRDKLRFPPAEIAHHVVKPFRFVKAHVAEVEARVERNRVELAAVEGPRARGRAIARANAEAGRTKLLAAVEQEDRRHAAAMGALESAATMAKTPAAELRARADLAVESERHAAKVAELDAKASAVLSALAAVSD